MQKLFYLMPDPWFIIIATFFTLGLFQCIGWILGKKTKVFNGVPTRIRISVLTISTSFIGIFWAYLMGLGGYAPTNIVALAVSNYIQWIAKVAMSVVNYNAFGETIFTLIAMYVLLLFLAFFPVIIISILIITYILKKITPVVRKRLIVITLISSIASTIIICWLYFTLSFHAQVSRQQCKFEANELTHMQQKLNELCNKTSDVSSCPKTEEELRSLQPRQYDRMKNCTDMHYLYSEKYGQLWLVQYHLNEYYPYSKNSRSPYPEKPYLNKDEVNSFIEIYKK